MVFSSTTFLLAFLPLVAILYYICPRKLRNGLLLVFSLLFYGWGEPKYILRSWAFSSTRILPSAT